MNLYYFTTQEPSKVRNGKLIDALELQQFLRDIEDEEDWIREKEPIASSVNKGSYLIFNNSFYTYWFK